MTVGSRVRTIGSGALASHLALFLVALLAGALACTGERPGAAESASRVGARPVTSADVDALFAEFERDGTPGAAVLVLRDGEVVHRRGYGIANLEAGAPIGPATSFRLGSVSKQFLCMAVMILAEEGRLDIDDPAVEHVPELTRFGEEMTVRHLMTHTAGLPDYYEELGRRSREEDSRPRNEDAAELFEEWGEPEFAPGERYEYSNPGYEMLALVAERASGLSTRELLENRIFEPLGMERSTVLDHTDPEIPGRATGYSRDGEGGFEVNDDHVLNDLVGSGAVYSSLDDLRLWIEALSAERLVSSETLAEVFSPAELADGSEIAYGLGWRIGEHRGRRVIDHSGSWIGFNTYLARYPEEGLAVVVLSNLSSEDYSASQAGRFLSALYLDGVPTEAAATTEAASAGSSASPATGSESPSDVPPAGPESASDSTSLLIRDAVLVDGTGVSRRPASVRIEDGRIAEVGELEPRPDEPVVDADGLALAPGFIDTHSHADGQIFEHPDAEAATSQGIATVVVGQDGGSPHPLAEFFEKLESHGTAVNVASYAGHGTLRRLVMEDDFRRPATDAETRRMRELLAREMESGALGLSTGLEYDPGIYATTEEVVALAREAGRRGGRYASHVRSEDRAFWEALEEAIRIGDEAGVPVLVSHLKLATRSLHDRADELVDRLDRARAAGIRISADVYPYTYWQSTLTVMFPERDFEDREAARYAVTELSTPREMLIATYAPEPAYEGKTLAEIAELRGTDPVTTLIELIRDAEAMRERLDEEQGEEVDVESVIATSMDEGDVARLLQWQYANVCTDGELAGAHPRGYGSFTRVLGRYVREREVLELEEAVHRMSGRAADAVGILQRGRIWPGLHADLVLFDPDRVIDRATTEEPRAPSEGIEKVWVGGRLVFADGEATGERPGSVVRRHPRPTSE